MSNRKIKIASFPTPAKDKYYFWLYYDHLQKYGIELLDTKKTSFSKEWLDENKNNVDVVHFHWPAYIYSKSDFKEFFDSMIGFIGLLRLAKKYKIKIVWTVHNLFPHERNNMLLEYITRLSLCWYTDALFVHFWGAKERIKRLFFKKSNVYVIPHGTFEEVFPNTKNRLQARQVLEIQEDAFVYLMFGPIRPYKGIVDAIDAFLRCKEDNDILLIVGSPSDKGLSDYVAKQSIARIGIKSHIYLVDKADVCVFFNSADVVLLPYKDVFTSGNLFLAITFKVPVICPDIGIMEDLVNDHIGVKYDRNDRSGLLNAMIDIKKRKHHQEYFCFEDAIKNNSWEIAAKTSSDIFRGICN
jgi:beta-1,4-mannosyltransferase